MKTIKEIQEALAQCYGTEGYHQWNPLFRKMVLTDGTKTVAEMCGAYWLMDLIGSYQSKCLGDEMLRDMQFWTLRKKGDDWEVICERDTDDIFLTQDIPFSDFPLPEGIKLYVAPADEEYYVIMLPSEY